MQVLELNRPAISTQLSINQLEIKVYTHGASHYGDNKIVLNATADRPVYRLCKDYTRNALTFGLNIITYDNNADKVEKWLDKLAKQLTVEQIQDGINSQPFKFLEERYK